MTVPAARTILMIHPPSATLPTPPIKLTQVTAFLSTISTTNHRWDARIDESNGIGSVLPTLLKRLSASHRTGYFFLPDQLTPIQLKALLSEYGERRTGCRLSLSCAAKKGMALDFTALNDASAIVQIQWRVTGPLPDMAFFKAFSRAGIWNHLVLDGADVSLDACRAIVSQPNIIHSWENTPADDPSCHVNEIYGQVRPLPGRPLWQTVNDPVKQFLLVDRLTKDRLLRLRVDNDGERLFTIGTSLEYHFLPPDRLPDGCLAEICAMVAAGGTVAATHVRFNLERAHLIGYVEEKGVIVGNSSLKNPRPEYIDSVRRQSGLELTGFVERGYTSVRPEYRGLGIGTRLLEGLTARAGDRKIFSVIAEDNTATQIIAKRNRTRKVAAYYSEKAGKPVGIWMPEWTIDKTISP